MTKSATLVLRILNGAQRGQEHALVRERYDLGKHESNDIVLMDQTVSRNHCELIREPGGYRLRDMGSTNGTLVDGAPVRETSLRPGAVLTLGQVDLRILSAAPEHLSEHPRHFDTNKSYRETKAEWEEAFEASFVSWLLEVHSGNISAAARGAKMDRKYLYKLAVRYGLHKPRTRK